MLKLRSRASRSMLALGLGGALLVGTGGMAMADSPVGTPEQECAVLKDSPLDYQRCLKAYRGSTPEEMAAAAGDPRYAPPKQSAQPAPKAAPQKATGKKAPAKKPSKAPSKSKAKGKK